jgi:long-chain fatty acid transport protein
MRKKLVSLTALAVTAVLANPGISSATNGYFLHGVGPVNDALGGAAVAGNAQDLLGSIHRNPANGSLFTGDVAAIGLGAIFPDATINSSVDALGLTGSSSSEVDVIPFLNMGMVLNSETSSLTYYAAVISEAGLHLDIPASTTNPIFIHQAGSPDNPFVGMFGGFGPTETQVELVRIPLGIANKINEKWSVGFSVAPSIQRMKFTPGCFDDPDDVNGDGMPTYSRVSDHDVALGIGFQFGVNYQPAEKVRLGFSLISPTWLEKHEWDVKDELGNTRKISTRQNRPMSARLGTSFQVTPDTLMLLDAEWINYSDTEGFDETGFSSTGALKGVGWDDAWVLSLGIQQNVNDNFILRAGYNYNTNPIDEDVTFYNAASPLHSQHHLSLGLSYQLFKEVFFDVAYTHAFESSQSSTFYTPQGAVPDTEIGTVLEYDQINFGVTFQF